MYVGILNEYTCRSVLSSSGYNYLKTMIIVAFSLSQIYWLNFHWIFSKYLIFCKTELSIGFIIMYLILSQISTVLCILYMCITYKYEVIYMKINYGVNSGSLLVKKYSQTNCILLIKNSLPDAGRLINKYIIYYNNI